MTANTEAAYAAAKTAMTTDQMRATLRAAGMQWLEGQDAFFDGYARRVVDAAAPHLVAAVPDAAVEAAVLAAVQAERDACADIAETLHRNWNHVDVMFDQDTAMQVSYAIRARSAAPLPPKGREI